MENFLETLATQVPNLAVLGVIVWLFIRYLTKKDALSKTISDSCHEIQTRAITSIDKNTEVLGQVKDMLHKVNGVERRQ